jgi:hypothetical protein
VRAAHQGFVEGHGGAGRGRGRGEARQVGLMPWFRAPMSWFGLWHAPLARRSGVSVGGHDVFSARRRRQRGRRGFHLRGVVGGLTATARPSSAATARRSWTGAGATFPDGGVLASFSSRTIAAEGILGFSLGDLDGGGAGRNNKGCGSGLLKGQG